MPFPWKKAKGKRFSQLVSNHLQPPKRGASLILETGFPASLADLFVKNRDRFNNFNSSTNTNNTNNNNNNNNNVVDDSRKKKTKKRAIPPPAPIVIPPPPSPLHSTTRNSSNLPTPSRVLFVPSPRPCGDSVLGDDVAFLCDPSDCEAVSGKHVFVAVLKMFFVVMMALGAKRFSVGIAISAFFLLLLEYLGRRLGGLHATSASARWMSYWFAGFLKRFEKMGVEAPIQEIGLESPVQEIGFCSDLDSSKGSLGNPSTCRMEDLVSEIHVVQPSTTLVPPIREIPSVKYEINLRNGNEKWAEKAEEEVIETKQEQCSSLSELLISEGDTGRATRRSKIKSKIKTLANKLNGSKSKRKKRKNVNEFKCEERESSVTTNQGDEERELEVESIDESMPSNGVDFDADRVNIEGSICLEDSSVNDKKENSIEYGGRERSSSQYLVILVIVLVGLVGGRVLGLVFALSWFLILKFGLRCVTN